MPGRRLCWLVIPKLFSHKKVTASSYLVSRELLSMCEFRLRPSGSGGDPPKRQQDHKVESDISLTRVTFRFQPCKCPFAKNRTACTGLHLVRSLRCSVYQRLTRAPLGRILPFFGPIVASCGVHLRLSESVSDYLKPRKPPDDWPPLPRCKRSNPGTFERSELKLLLHHAADGVTAGLGCRIWRCLA